eukprot:6073252-Prymnesium_polylepis.1
MKGQEEARFGRQRFRQPWRRIQFDCARATHTAYCRVAGLRGRWPMEAPGGGDGRYAALRCLWHEVRVKSRLKKKKKKKSPAPKDVSSADRISR